MGGGAGAPERFSVTVPGRADLVGTLRAFTSAVARHHSLPDDAVEDFKLAVSEACTDPVEARAGGDLSLEIELRDDALVCVISSPSWTPVASRVRALDLPEEVRADALDRMQLVRALFPDAQRADVDGRVTVRFSGGSRREAPPAG